MKTPRHVDASQRRDLLRRNIAVAQARGVDVGAPEVVFPAGNNILFSPVEPFLTSERLKLPLGSMGMEAVNLSRYDHVREALRRSGNEGANQGELSQDFEPALARWTRRYLGLGHPTNGGPWMAEGKRHSDILAYIRPDLTPKNVMAMDGDIQDVCSLALDEALEARPALLDVAQYTNTVHFRLIAKLLGIKTNLAPMLQDWIRVFNQSPSIAAPKYSHRTNKQLGKLIRGAEAAHRAGLEVPGIIGRVALGHMQGTKLGDSRMTLPDAESVVWVVIAAGTETPSNTANNTVLFALQDGSFRQLADAETADLYVDEANRFYPPFPEVLTKAAQDTVIDGYSIRKGQWIRAHLPAANRDPDKFENPHGFEPGRPNRHAMLSFGAGMHYCIGAHFGLRVAKRAVSALSQRLPNASLLPLENYEREKGPLHRFDVMPIQTGL